MLLVAGTIWPFAARWYDQGLIALLRPFVSQSVGLDAVGTTMVFARASPITIVTIPGLGLHVALVLPVAVILASPAMRVAMRCAWALGIALLVGLSQLLILWYLAQSLGKGTVIDVPSLFGVYWSIVPGALVVGWCYFFWLPKFSRVASSQ